MVLQLQRTKIAAVNRQMRKVLRDSEETYKSALTLDFAVEDTVTIPRQEMPLDPYFSQPSMKRTWKSWKENSAGIAFS